MFIVENISGTYFYHLSKTGQNLKPSLCGYENVMRTKLSLHNWGKKNHLNQIYCKQCEDKSKLICYNDNCNWFGPINKCVSQKHSRNLLCPACYENLE